MACQWPCPRLPSSGRLRSWIYPTRPEDTITANPFVPVERMTGDVDKAKAFYGALSGLDRKDGPEMNYTIGKVGDGVVRRPGRSGRRPLRALAAKDAGMGEGERKRGHGIP